MANKIINNCNSSGAVYGLGIIGSLFYYFSHVQSFTEGLIGFGKSLVWPAILVFKALELLKI
jgi:hypothetical protein